MTMEFLAYEVEFFFTVSDGSAVTNGADAVRSDGRPQVASLGVGVECWHLVGVAGLPVDLGAEVVLLSGDQDVEIWQLFVVFYVGSDQGRSQEF